MYTFSLRNNDQITGTVKSFAFANLWDFVLTVRTQFGIVVLTANEISQSEVGSWIDCLTDGKCWGENNAFSICRTVGSFNQEYIDDMISLFAPAAKVREWDAAYNRYHDGITITFYCDATDPVRAYNAA